MNVPNREEPTAKYKECFKKGVLYQDFVMSMLIKHRGYAVTNFSSRWFQVNVGESLQGVETKLCSHTESLFIETHKKFHPENKDWTPSGINRKNNTKIYVVGNYFLFYLFDVKVLRKRVKESRYLGEFDKNIGKGIFTSDTGKGVYMPISEIEEDDCYIDKIECREDGELFSENLKNSRTA